MARTVFCTYLQRDAEGLDRAPYPGELGQRVYASISKEAWGAWVRHQTMLMNEYRLTPIDPKARKFLVEGTQPNLKKIKEYVDRSLMLVTALAPVIGYDKASKIAHYAIDHDLTLKEAALKLEYVTEAEFDKVVDPSKMVHPYVATE